MGNERKKLEFMAEKLGIKENIIFTGFRKDVKEILEALDILVLPSIREGQPITLLETMPMGKAIVATNIEGVNETIDNDITGVLVTPKDSDALAEAIVYLLKDREKAQEMDRVAKRTIEEKFDIKDKIEQHQQLYETIQRH